MLYKKFRYVVKIIPLGRDGDGPGKGFLGRGQVEEGQLEPDGAVKVVEEIAPALEDGGLILVLGQLVIDVLKLNGLGIIAAIAAGHAADAVRPHPFKGRAARLFIQRCFGLDMYLQVCPLQFF